MKPRQLVALAVALHGWTACAAMGLQEAYEAAVLADLKYQADRHERDATRHALPIARAALRPTLQLTASQLRYDGSRSVPGPAGSVTQDLNYSTPQQGLHLRQPLYNPEAWRGYEQAGRQAEFGERVFAVRGLELADRLATAYLTVLLAAEELRLTQAHERALGAQAQSAQRRLDRGEGTRIEILETVARLDIARARRVDAQDAQTLARAELQNIVGRDVETLQGLPPGFAPPLLAPAGLAPWLERAAAASPVLATRRQAVLVAEAEVARSRAGHLPRLEMVAGITRSRSESVSTLDQQLNQRFIGLQLSVPLYAGGQIDARTDQALARLRRAEAEWELERKTVETQVRRFFLATSNAQERLAAHLRAVSASEAALEGTRRGFAAGLRTNVEVLDAYHQVFVSRRESMQAQHDHLLAYLRLHSQSGTPAGEAIAIVARLLSAHP